MQLGPNDMRKNESLRKKAQGQLKSLLADCLITNYKHKRLLEIGFKNGLFLDECYNSGIDAIGLEISSQYYENAKKDFQHLNLFHYEGDKFPFADNYFDMVVSFQVLEHVNSTEHIINESLRVLKPGGIMYHVCPNYHSFYEGHYNVLWLPFLNKRFGKIYLSLLKKNTLNFDQFNLVQPKMLINIMDKNADNAELISLGQKEFIAKFNEEQIQKINQKFLKKILEFFVFIPGLKQFLVWLICLLKFYYPITLISKKRYEK